MFNKPTLDPQFSKHLWVQQEVPLQSELMGSHLALGSCEPQEKTSSIQAHGEKYRVFILCPPFLGEVCPVLAI